MEQGHWEHGFLEHGELTHPDIAALVTPLCFAKRGLKYQNKDFFTLFPPQAKRGSTGEGRRGESSPAFMN